MEEAATCKSCHNQSWLIYEKKIVCSECAKEYSISAADLKARDVIFLVNDNH